MTDRLIIDIANEAELNRRLGSIVERLERPRELMDRIGAVLEANINRRFDTKTAPDGSAWLPLAQSTRDAYAVKYDGNIPGSLLQRTGHMRDSLTRPGYDARDHYVDVGFGDAIALHHEFGTRRGLPRRQLLTDDPVAGTLGEQDREDVFDEIAAFLASL